MKLKHYLNEEIDPKKKKARATLKKQLQKLDTDIDLMLDNIEKEIDKIEENPVFHSKLSLMLTNTEKECGEFLIALRQLISTLGRNANIIPSARGHAQGMPGEDREPVKELGKPKEEEELLKKVKKDKVR